MAEPTSSKPIFPHTIIELEDTFDSWRTRTNQNTDFLRDFNNYYYSAIGEMSHLSTSNFNAPIPTNLVEAINQLVTRVRQLEINAGP